MLAKKILRQSYYCPTMEEDCIKFVRHCEKCQLHANRIHAPASSLHLLSSPWPFSMWAFDVVGPLSKIGTKAPKHKSFILTATVYYTKWAEAEAFAKIKASTVVKFIKTNIIARFDIIKAIVIDNGPQFISQDSKVCATGMKFNYIIHWHIIYKKTNKLRLPIKL